MSASEADLLLKLGAISTIKSDLAPTVKAVTDLRTHVGNELNAITALGDRAIAQLTEHLNVFAVERIPVGGGLFVNLTNSLHHLEQQGEATGSKLSGFNKTVDDLAKHTGKSGDEIRSFVSTFAKLPDAAAKNDAAFKMFGGSVDEAGNRTAALLPQLTEASTQLTALQASTESFAGTLAAAAGPLLLGAALAAAEVAVLYELIEVTTEASEHFTHYGEELGKAAIQTGLSVEQLHGLKLLADENNVSFQGLTLGFGRYLRAVIEAQQGNKTFGEEFERLGIDVTKLGDDPRAAIQALIEAFNRLGPSMLTNQAAIALLGREGVRVVGALIAAGGSLDEITAKAQQFSKFTGEDTKAAKALSEELAATKFAVEGYYLELGRTVEPIVLEFQKEFLKLLIENKEEIGDVIVAFGKFIEVNGQMLMIALKGTIEVVHQLTVAWNTLKIAAEAATLVGIPKALADSQAQYEAEKKRFEGEEKPETPEESARRSLVPVASTLPSTDLTRFAGLVSPPPPPQPETQDVTSLKLKKSLEELRVAADQVAIATAASMAQTESKIKEGTVAFAAGTKAIEGELAKQTQAQLNYLGEQKRQLEEQKSRAVTPVDAFKVQTEINKIDQSILAAQTKFQTDYAAKETALRDHLRVEKIKALEGDAKIERDAAERIYAARENQGKLSAEAELAATQARNKAIFDVDRQLLANKISLYPKQAEARRDLERTLTELETKRTSEILTEENKRTENTRNAIKDRIEIASIGTQSELAITRTKNAEVLAEARALTAGLKIIASDQLTLELGFLAAKSDARIKAINDEIAMQEKQKAAITARGQVAGLSVEDQVKQEQVVNGELERLYAQRIHLYNEDVAAATSRHFTHEKLAQLETQLALNEKNAEIAIAEQEQKDLASKGLTPEEKANQMAALNARIRELTEERNQIQKEGNIRSAEARQEDLDDLAKYENAYERLVIAGLQLDQEISRLHVRLLITMRASRLEIIQAQFEAEQDADEKHHAQELKRLKDEYDAAIKSAKTMQDKLTALKKYHADVEKENKRQDLSDEERAKRKAREEALAGPGGGFNTGLESGQLAKLEDGVKSFADVSTVAFSAIGAAVNGLAQGIGSMVQQWVLMGNVGPDAARKMVAGVLASLAAQAAVQAIMELAYGFAALTVWGAPIYGPASNHFIAAALFGSVAAASAVAGRVVAGNAFQSGGGGSTGASGGGGTGGGGSGSSSSSASGGPQTINMGRQQVTVVINMHGELATDAFKTKVIGAVVTGVNDNHPQLNTAIRKVGS